MQNRAYSVLEIKAVDEAARTLTGIATTPSVDRVGDIIEAEGVKFTNPMPFLWQHNHDQPIGTVEFDTPTKDGVKFRAKLPIIEEAGVLRDRIEEAWQSMKAGLVRAVSIGFRPLEYAFMDGGGIRFNQVEVYELSAVTIPANSEALITSIKSIDAALRKEAGVPDPEVPRDEAPGSIFRKLDERGQAEFDAFIGNKIPTPPEPAASGNTVPVVRLNAPLASEPPFVINKIHPVRQ